MTLAQLRAFWFAATLGSFTAAAERLGATQPTVSELVRKLEVQTGLPLFIRAGRRLTLTEGGSELLPWAQLIIDGVDQAEAALRALRGLEGGVASFGVLRNAPFYFLSDLVERFHVARPKVRTRIVGQNSVEVAEAVRSGDLEAGLVVLPIASENLEIEPLLRDEVFWVSSDESRVSTPISIDAVGKAPLILYDAHYGWMDPTRRQLAERAEAAGIQLDPLIEVENVEAALALVARGIGETIASQSVTRHQSFPPHLYAVSFADPFYETIALIKRRYTALSPGTAELANLAATALRSIPWGTRLT